MMPSRGSMHAYLLAPASLLNSTLTLMCRIACDVKILAIVHARWSKLSRQKSLSVTPPFATTPKLSSILLMHACSHGWPPTQTLASLDWQGASLRQSSPVPQCDRCTVAGSVVGPLSAMLLKLYVLRQPMLSRSSTDCLEMLCSARNSHLGAAALGDLLQQVLQQESAWLQKDADLMLALTKLVETGFIRLVCHLV